MRNFTRIIPDITRCARVTALGSGFFKVGERLRETYERFTEGFDFPDLQDAAALIAEAGCRASLNPASKAES